MTENSRQNQPSNKIVIDDHTMLSVLADSEADLLYSLVDKNRQYLAEFLPWAASNNRDDSIDFIKKVHNDRGAKTDYGYGIYIDDVLVGHISLMHLSPGQTPEIGYWIGEEYSGRGITTRAAEKITQLGITELDLDVIVLKTAVTNPASNKIAQKLGYKKISVEQDDEDRTINVWRKTQ